ncbi:MAG: putative ABC transporter permease subunit [Verrucomicrobiales bacterium]
MMGHPETRAFRRLRWRQALNHVRSLWQEHPLRLATPVASTTVLALMVFGFSWAGFREIERHRATFAGSLIASLFDVLFSALGAMLLISTGIILYASLFTSAEARFLLSTPAAAWRIFATKFQSAAAFSSFGFIVLGFPILVAYGLVAQVSLWYLFLLPVFLVGFSLLPAALSSIACLLLMRLPRRHRAMTLGVLGSVLMIVVGVWLHRVGTSTRQAIAAANPDAVRAVIGHFSLTSHPMQPGRWMTAGLLAAARGEIGPSLRWLALLWGAGLAAYGLALHLSARTYRAAYHETAGGGRRRGRLGGHWLDRIMGMLVRYLDRPTRLLVVKDFRSFRRDPSQWALLVVFALMLALGAGNLRSFTTRIPDGFDLSLIGLAQLAGTAVLLCAGLSRFIFPLVSLEGRRFWILGLMPIGRRQILAGKFAFAATCSTLAGLVIVVGSELLLGLPGPTVFVHAITIASVAIGLSGLNVGLGACLANFRETDASRIVVGPNGTINMVIGLLFLTVATVVMAGPLHAAFMLDHRTPSDSLIPPPWIYAGLPIGLTLSAGAAWIPLRLGRRALEQAEF